MAEISVIVPVYRAERYLPACLDSLLSQSFTDFELILVDDGSPDRCGEICEEYARRDSRITVLHQQNQGQAAARNHAMKTAKAPWICFVDSDDLIHPQTLDLMYRAVKENDVPMSACQMLEAPELPENFFAPVEPEVQLVSITDSTLSQMYDAGAYPAWVACGKLIRRELIENYLFRAGRVYEDNEAVCRWVAWAGKLAQLPQNLYFYRTNPGSTTQRDFSLKKLDFLWAMESIIRFYGGLGFVQIRDRFFDRYVRETGTCWRMVHNGMNLPREAKKLKKNLHALMRQEGLRMNTEQFEFFLDATHTRLVRFYWPVAGLARTLRQGGVSGMLRKLKKTFGRRQNMIPKIIHYCWFGGKPKPPLAEKCIKSWKKFCPDYEIIEWNEHNFDISAAPKYVQEAHSVGRWAFVTDYVRLKAMTEQGGIYMDTDVEIVKPLDSYLHHQGFAGFESLKGVQTGLLASEPGFPLFLDFMKYYDTASFIKPDGSHDTTTNVQTLTRLCVDRGLQLNDKYQVVDGFAVYPREYFCPVDFDTKKLKRTRKTATIHWFANSWHTQEELEAEKAEKRRLKEEKRSELRYGLGTKFLGEKGYEKLKAFIKR